jgi:hypothetical protein
MECPSRRKGAGECNSVCNESGRLRASAYGLHRVPRITDCEASVIYREIQARWSKPPRVSRLEIRCRVSPGCGFEPRALRSKFFDNQSL